MTLAVPDVIAVKVELQVTVAVVPDRMHAVKLPVTPVWLRVRVPVGVVAPVVEMSVTDTLHVEPWLARTGVVHETVVVVW